MRSYYARAARSRTVCWRRVAAPGSSCKVLVPRAPPYAMGGVYVNFMTEDETDRIAAAYGPNYERLSKVKRRYDPENLFHLNQNIKPAS